MDKEMIVQVLADGEEIVVKLFDLLVLAEHLDILHLSINHVIETFNELVLELVGKGVAREISKTLVYQPQVHVSD